MPVVRRAGQQAGPAIGHGQVPVGRRDQDDPSGERLAVLGVPGGQRAARDRMCGSTVGPVGVICSTTRTAAAKSSGSQDTKARSASTPPADAATATAAGGRGVG